MFKVGISLFALLIFLLPVHSQAWAGPTLPSNKTQQSTHNIDVNNSCVARTGKDCEPIKLMLGDAIYLGLRNNRGIRSAYLERISQKFDLRVVESRFRPRADIIANVISGRNQSGSYQQINLTPTATWVSPYGTRVSLGWSAQRSRDGSVSPFYNDGANINIIQPLLRGAGWEIGTAPVRIARMNEVINQLSLKTTVAQTVTSIIKSYRDLLQNQAQLEIVQNSLKRAKDLVQVNRALIEAGRMAEVDIVQTEAEQASQELAYEEAANNLDRGRLALLQLLVLKLDTQVVATEELRATFVDIQAADALAQAESYQPTWLARLIASEQADLNLAVAKNNQLWDLSITLGSSQLRNRFAPDSASTIRDNYAGLLLQIPLGDLSIKQAEVQAQVNVQSRKEQLAIAHQQLERDVINGVRDIGVRWRQYEISKRALELSRRKLEIEKEKLTVGRSSNFQVLSFENDLRNAENSQLNALIGYLNGLSDLDFVLGTTLQSWDISIND